MSLERTPEGKMVLYRVSDGQRFVRWPIDAREMLASREYTADPTNGNAIASEPTSDTASAATVTPAPLASNDPVPHLTAAQAQIDAQSPVGVPLVTVPQGAQSSATRRRK